jgi:hypothetical protein
MKLVNDIEKLTKPYYLVDFFGTENERLKTFFNIIFTDPASSTTSLPASAQWRTRTWALW